MAPRVREPSANRSIRSAVTAKCHGCALCALSGWANYFRHGVSKATFGAIDHHAWGRITRWIFRKHSRINWRFCRPGTWKIAHDGVTFTGASSVRVRRYRYRGNTIATPWTSTPATTPVAA